MSSWIKGTPANDVKKKSVVS